ncbi:MFS transporter [Fervidibacillus albus]|uniref:MFS transporter n=1 Tax=Fervidibacillus albus TaxID=2980026 RepID=A0A9E8LS55_9BACI|nr:MFS transporter [Fervidibacillus albus]WAA08590.1 MFS transporter [Fervidibacillus albus]
MKKHWWLGFGFFSISLTWSLYNAFVPYFLESYISSVAVIGFLMTLDNYVALFLQPFIGRISDKTDTRLGKRMPYLIVGMPLSALFVILLPFHQSVFALVTFMLLLNLSMALFRSPTIALMPDITPEEKRTKANGIINFMGGVAAIIAFALGSQLFKWNEASPFLFSGIVLLLSLIILLWKIREKRDSITVYPSKKEQKKWVTEFNQPTVFLLIAIFFWFVAYQGMEALFTLYGKNHLGLSKDQSSFSLTFFSLSFVLFAIPSGFLASKLGKKKMIIIGIAGLATVFLLLNFVYSLTMLWVLLLFGGIFWAFININSYPFVVSTGSDQSIGTRTGLYYLVSSLAAISGPPLFGLIVDSFGYGALFFSAAISLVIALFFIMNVKTENSVQIDGHQ